MIKLLPLLYEIRIGVTPEQIDDFVENEKFAEFYNSLSNEIKIKWGHILNKYGRNKDENENWYKWLESLNMNEISKLYDEMQNFYKTNKI